MSIVRVPLTVIITTTLGWAGLFLLMFCVAAAARVFGAGEMSDQTFFTFVWAGGLVGFCVGIAIVVQPVHRRDRREKMTFGFPVERARDAG